ncbi:MAG: hypothetical protein ACI392_01095 [Paludibacteraceae bacterium]
MTKRLFFALIGIVCGCVSLVAQHSDVPLQERFEARETHIGRLTLPYRVAQTGTIADGDAPILVVLLHGSSAKGTDNMAQLAAAGVAPIIHYLDSVGLEAHVLLPQCPKKRRWSEPEDEGREMQALIKMWIADYAAANKIDMSRIYIAGASSGGAGVWKLLNDYSDFFAAGMLVASYPRYVVDWVVAKTPVCCVVGENDEVATPAELTKFTDKLMAFGGNVLFRILPQKDHYATCRDGFSTECLQWLFEQKRNVR